MMISKSGMSMTPLLVPDQIADHLQAIQTLTRREVFSRLLDQADDLARQGYLAAAVLLAGAVVEQHTRQPLSPTSADVPASMRAVWLSLHDQATHGQLSEAVSKEVGAMLAGVRNLLIDPEGSRTPSPLPSETRADAIARVRGKYAYVPTSSEAFLARRAEERREDEL